jgi:hypothetical protein
MIDSLIRQLCSLCSKRLTLYSERAVSSIKRGMDDFTPQCKVKFSTKTDRNLFMAHWRSKLSWRPLLIGAGILTLAHYTAFLFRIQPTVSLWFPPSGVAIALAIWFGPPAAIVTGLVSTVMAPLWGNQGWTQWVGWTDATEPLIAWWLYRHIWQQSINLNRLRDVSAFIFSAPVIACASSAIFGSFALALFGNLSWQAILPAIPHWWLTNAIKFTPQGGQVTITLEELNSESNPENAQVGSTAQIRISDTGKGIEPDLLPHVFEPFWQEDSKITRNFGGLGLGLAIVRHLVELHHGKVAVHSDGINCGTTFFVQLPYHTNPPNSGNLLNEQCTRGGSDPCSNSRS